MGKVLVVGACGQIGTELVLALQDLKGKQNVIAADIRDEYSNSNVIYEKLDILDKELLRFIIEKHDISEVYNLAALLSGTAEKHPDFAWKLNMEGLFNTLDLAKEGILKKIFWPSSIAVFGPTTPKSDTPQIAVSEPNTVYGISKLAGERWCEYYHDKYGVDVRSIRYPGLISYTAQPGGGTTDYAVEIFHEAKKSGKYECFLNESTALPMMYMADAIKATIAIMEADGDDVKVRSSYNIAGFTFTPEELANEIKELQPNFEISYKEDFRQKIANSWPSSINDHKATEDWGWKPDYSLKEMVKVMMENVDVTV